MRLFTNLVLLGLGLVGSVHAKSVCCTSSCRLCSLEECHWGYCTSIIFNTCCAVDKKYKTFMTEEEYLAAIA